MRIDSHKLIGKRVILQVNYSYGHYYAHKGNRGNIIAVWGDLVDEKITISHYRVQFDEVPNNGFWVEIEECELY